jgi:hypothetical protein
MELVWMAFYLMRPRAFDFTRWDPPDGPAARSHLCSPMSSVVRDNPVGTGPSGTVPNRPKQSPDTQTLENCTELDFELSYDLKNW